MGWVVHMRHYLDDKTGDLPDGLPTPALDLVLFFGSIVAWVTDGATRRDPTTLAAAHLVVVRAHRRAGQVQ